MSISHRSVSLRAPHSWMGLQAWYEQPSGQRFGIAETRILEDILPLLFGYYLVALGEPVGSDALAFSPVSRRWFMGFPGALERRVDLQVEPGQLPFATDSVDVLILSHVLECCADPISALKEVDRVLIPEGHIIILGFNPYSLWGLWPGLSRRRRVNRPLQGGAMHSVPRLRSWLALLGLETLKVRFHSYRPPMHSTVGYSRLALLETVGQRYLRPLGGGYVLLAKKRVSTLTPIRPRWFARRPLSNEGIATLYEGEWSAMMDPHSPPRTAPTDPINDKEAI